MLCVTINIYTVAPTWKLTWGQVTLKGMMQCSSVLTSLLVALALLEFCLWPRPSIAWNLHLLPPAVVELLLLSTTSMKWAQNLDLFLIIFRLPDQNLNFLMYEQINSEYDLLQRNRGTRRRRHTTDHTKDQSITGILGEGIHGLQLHRYTRKTMVTEGSPKASFHSKHPSSWQYFG